MNLSFNCLLDKCNNLPLKNLWDYYTQNKEDLHCTIHLFCTGQWWNGSKTILPECLIYFDNVRLSYS